MMKTKVIATTHTSATMQTSATMLTSESDNALVINTAESAGHYRAHVYQMPSGTIVTVPVQEGSRGPLYTAFLTSTKHGQLRTTRHSIQLTFTFPLSEGGEHAAQCLGEEFGHFIDYLKYKF